MWYFHSPKIAFGEDALAVLEQLTGGRAFIVTDSVMVDLGFVGQVKERLSRAGIASAVFDQVEPDPGLATVERCAAAMDDYKPDLVIGLGGGSCLDAAKAAWFLYERPDIDLAAVNPFEVFGLRSKARLVAIATTAGSGAEVTGGAVITDSAAQRKMEVPTYELVPDFAIVDPAFTLDLPAQLTADTGIDVLAHAVEGYASTFANDFSDGLCLHAIRLVFTYLPRAYENGAADPEARQKIANAAAIAGLGVGASHIALAHALAHSLGVLFHVNHGRASGLFLPYTIEFNAIQGGGRYLDVAQLLQLPVEDETQAAGALAEAVRGLLRRLDLPSDLEQAGVDHEDFRARLDALCERVEMDSALATCLRFPYRQEIQSLFEHAYAGRRVDF
ncbi:MAG: iron-containing alcohol dehydrogenase [Anaerolineales bacterium]|nr:iron-containing alcohol dehydrogenase [Anaerolineales bacterium]